MTPPNRFVHCFLCEHYETHGEYADLKQSRGVCRKYNYPVTGLMCCWWVEKFIPTESDAPQKKDGE